MANEKVLNTRVKLKYATLSEWTAADPVLLQGEMAIVVVPADSNAIAQEPAILTKIGDGEKKFSELPYTSAIAGDVHNWAKAATKPTYTATEINGLADYISGKVQDTNTTYQVVALEDGMGFEVKSKELGGDWATVATVDFEDKFVKKIVTGTANGTISVDGVEVVVAGLGSAAFTDSSAYDAAGAAAAVDTKLTAEVSRAKAAEEANVAAIAEEKARAEDAEADLLAKVTANSDAIGVLNGNGDGSVKKAVDDAINKFATDVTDDAVVNSYKELIDWVAKHGSEATEMTSAIQALEAIVDGIGDVGAGEKATVVTYVNDAIAALNIGDYAKAADLTALAARVTTAEGKIAAVEADYLKAADKTALQTAIDGKVDKVEGSRLMTTAEGEKLAYIDTGAQVNVIEKILVNGVEQTINGKSVDLDVVTNIDNLDQTAGTYVVFDCGSASVNI